MTHFLGSIFIILICALPFLGVEIFSSSTFVSDFLTGQSSEIMGTMLAINLATLTFLVGDLMRIEHELKKEMFSGTIREMKHNIIFMFAVFVIHLFFLAITPNTLPFGGKPKFYFVCRAVNLLAFSAYIFALWEMTSAVFMVRDTMKKIREQE